MEKGYRVLIIGAGIAGLSCGKYLLEKNIEDFLIVEANDQIGGRCQTISFQDHQLDLGAEVLYGNPSTNPLYQLADEHHLIDHDDNRFDRDDCYHDEDGQSIDEDVINEIRQIYDEILEKKIPAYPYENYPDVSLGELLSTEIDQYLQSNKSIFDHEQFNQRQKVIHWLGLQHPHLTAIGAGRLGDVSVQGWNSFERLSNNGQAKDDDTIGYLRGGFVHFLQTVFVRKITTDRIRLNSIVKRIAVHEQEDCVTVEIVGLSKQTTTYQVKHVVCTQSIGYLKHAMNDVFIPPLPYAKQMSIENLGFTTIKKPFWDVDFNRFHFLWNTDSKWTLPCLQKTPYHSRWCRSITGLSVHHRLSNILVTTVHDEATRCIETMPDQLLAQCFQELFSHFYPDIQVPRPIEMISSRWLDNPLMFGSHTFVRIGSNINDVKQLALPWPNKPAQPLVLFAGEGTHERFYGTAHAAFITGIREAKRITDFYQSNP